MKYGVVFKKCFQDKSIGQLAHIFLFTSSSRCEFLLHNCTYHHAWFLLHNYIIMHDSCYTIVSSCMILVCWASLPPPCFGEMLTRQDTCNKCRVRDVEFSPALCILVGISFWLKLFVPTNQKPSSLKCCKISRDHWQDPVMSLLTG